MTVKPYRIGFSFGGYEAAHPTAAKPGSALDTEFQSIFKTLSDLVSYVGAGSPLSYRVVSSEGVFPFQMDTDDESIFVTVPLTAERTIKLPALTAADAFTIVRSATATGAYDLVVADSAGAVIDTLPYYAGVSYLKVTFNGTSYSTTYTTGSPPTSEVDGAHMKGEWNSSDTYEPLDQVSRNGSSYIARIYVTVNKDPATETDYWQVVAAKGANGANGVISSADADVSTWIATPTGANFAAIFAAGDMTGTGKLVFQDLPTISGATLTWTDVAASDGSFTPFRFLAGTLEASAKAGATEFDGATMHFTPENGNRGVVCVEHNVVLSSANTLTASTSQQPLFDGGGGPANGALTLVAGTYEFETLVHLSSLSGSAHTLTFSILGGGTATIGSARGQGSVVDSAVTIHVQTSQSQQVGSSGTTTTTCNFTVRGHFRVTSGGTIIPSITQGTNGAAAAVAVNSFFKCKRIGSSSHAYVGNWS